MSVDPEPVEPEPEARPEPPPATAPFHAMRRGGGFWCTEYKSSKYAGVVDCFRLESACKDQRKTATKARMRTSECAFAERAQCFEMADHDKQEFEYRCVSDTSDCAKLRAEYLSTFPDLLFSDCAVTE